MFNESDNLYAGVYYIPVTGQYAATAPDPIHVNKKINIGHFPSLEMAMAARINHMNQRDNRVQRQAVEFGEPTASTARQEVVSVQ